MLGNRVGKEKKKKTNMLRALACSGRQASSLIRSNEMERKQTHNKAVAQSSHSQTPKAQCKKRHQQHQQESRPRPAAQALKPRPLQILPSRVPVASLIPRSIRVATIVCRRRRRRRVHGHCSRAAGHHGQRAAGLLQHGELRVLGHDLHHALFLFFCLLTLLGLHPLTAFALALLDLLDFASGRC
jgi:hypothetical protein